MFSTASHSKNCFPQEFARDRRNSGTHEKAENRKADGCTLLNRITGLKCVNSEFKSVDINPTTEVASQGPMAPCRSHHRNHTRQEWIII